MFTKLEEQILNLEGIISCKITGGKEIDEIHIIARKIRDPKRIVRDIETMVLVETGNEISHKKISIAQVKGKSLSNSNRIEIISIYKENNNPVYHYKLKINDNLIQETVNGTAEDMLAIKIAEGLINIIKKYTKFRGRVVIEHSFITGLNDEIVIIQLKLYDSENGSSGEKLVGASYINHDLPLAAGKACLKALNRRLDIYS